MIALSDYKNKVVPFLQEQDIELTDEIKKAVMQKVNVRSILESWNVRPVLRNGQWTGYCPTHFIHDGHVSHAPKWSMNAETGDSTCFTSNRHENFITIAKKIYRFKTNKETIDKLLGGTTIEVPYELPAWKVEEKHLSQDEEKKRRENLKKTLDSFTELIRDAKESKECIDFFAKDGINQETIKSLHICSIDKGYYAGRCMIPFLNKANELCGFVAVNVMGKDWMIQHNTDVWCKINGEKHRKEALDHFTKNYKKALYCPGFQSRNHLYGWHEWLDESKIEDLILVEGERDAIKLLQEGFQAVSIHGTILKHEQLQIIRRINPKRVFLGFDMDKPGRDACEKIYNQLINEVNQVFILEFPDGKDPKKFCRDELKQIIEKAKGSIQI